MQNYITLDYNDFETFLRDISFNGKLYALGINDHYVFRGQSNAEWSLVPSLLRMSTKDFLKQVMIEKDIPILEERFHIECEFVILKSFYKIANEQGLFVPYSHVVHSNYHDFFNSRFKLMHPFVWYSEEVEPLAALAQHYGLPTRLLDWTQDIFVAIYFATRGWLGRENCGNSRFVIWMLNKTLVENNIISSNNDLHLRIITPSYHLNPFLNAQKGLFTYLQLQSDCIEQMVYAVDRTPVETLINNMKCSTKGAPLLIKVTIPASEHAKALYYLLQMGYHAARLFPGYNGVVKKMTENILLGRMD